MPYYDYYCMKDHLSESIRAGYDDELIECPTCGEDAIRLAVYDSQYLVTETGAKNERRTPAHLVPDDQKRYHLSGEFQEACEENEYNHKQAEESAGRELPTKPLWTAAKARLAAIQAGKMPRPKSRFVTAAK